MAETIRIAVIGAGHLGRFHARLIANNPDFQLVAVVDPVADARNALGDELLVRGVDSHHSLLGEIDAAVIATPTQQHHQIGMELLLKGKHLLIEKPLAGTVREADALVECATVGNCVLQVGHIERFNPALQEVYNQIDQPRLIEARRLSGYSFRSTDIGVVLDLMIHDVDIVLSIVRAKPIRIDAVGACVIGPQEDMASARIVFEDGCVANLSASRISDETLRQMQIWGSQCFITVDYSTATTKVMRSSDALLRGEYDVQRLSAVEKQQAKGQFFTDWLQVEHFNAESCNALDDELRDFVNAIQKGQSPRVGGIAGRDAVAVCEQIIERMVQHGWDGHADPPIGQGSLQIPATIPVPSFPVDTTTPRRRAG